MDIFKKEWLEIIKQQEALIKFDKFEQNDAWKVGKQIVELMCGKYKDCAQGVAIRVFLEHKLVFSLLQDGTSVTNNCWMDKKLNTAYKTNTSTLRAALEFKFGIREETDWSRQNEQYALVGGCIPILLKDDSIIGYVIVSNLAHEYDHQLAADAMAAILDVKIPSVTDA